MEVEVVVEGVKKVLTGKELEDWKYQRYMQDYLACVQSVDDNVGRVLDWLDANGLRNNTIVIYTSDQGFFLGEHGLILREQWVARPGVLEDLNRQFQFAVFTGRPKADAELTLNRFAGSVIFDPLVGMDDVEHHKPHPEGLLRILEANPGRKIYYIGDTVDDARCARAAKVPFIGIAAPSNPRYIDLVFLFQEEGAYAIVDDINFLQEVFAA